MAYAQAGWTPQMVDLIECHATGTPVGDAVEFESLPRLWEGGEWQHGQCVLSAVKSNIGHLLTAAGSAGLIKTLLAMQHGKLPPVANFEQPSDKVRLEGSPFAILQARARPWERRAAGVPRRAAINGFGFGGINAHLLIEEWLGQASRQARDAAAPAARTGCRRRHGDARRALAGPRRLSRSGFCTGKTAKEPAERAHWRGLGGEEIRRVWGRGFPGYFLDDLSVPIERFHIAPRELAEMLPQQLLMLDVAKLRARGRAESDSSTPRAAASSSASASTCAPPISISAGPSKQRAAEWAREAGLDAGSAETARWMEQLCDGAGPPLTADRTLGALGGIVASRIAREFHIGGPSHSISSEETSGLRALQVAVHALQKRELDVALAGAVDLNGDLRALLATDAQRRRERFPAKARPAWCSSASTTRSATATGSTP